MNLYDRLQARGGPPEASGVASTEKTPRKCLGCGAAVEVAQRHVRVVRCAACRPPGAVVTDSDGALGHGDASALEQRRIDAAKRGLTGGFL